MKEMPFENEKPSELILEKVSDILGNTREEILYNIEHNRHNNTTTSYELLLKRYKLNMGENVPLNEQRNSLGISGYQTTRNKTVDSFKEQPQTKSINININYVNKIGNININISDPIGKDDSKSEIKPKKTDKKQNQVIIDNESEEQDGGRLMTEPNVPTEYRKKEPIYKDDKKKSTLKNPITNKMAISLDLEKDSNIIKTSRDKESIFSKRYKEKLEENKRINTSSTNTEKEFFAPGSTRSTEPSGSGVNEHSNNINLQLKYKDKLNKHKFSNSEVSKSPKKLNILDKEPKVKQMEIISEEYEHYTRHHTITNKEVNIDKEKIFKISTISNIKDKFNISNPFNKINYAQSNRLSLPSHLTNHSIHSKEIEISNTVNTDDINPFASANLPNPANTAENKKKYKNYSVLEVSSARSENQSNIMSTVKPKIPSQTVFPTEIKDYSSSVCSTEPISITPVSSTIRNQNNSSHKPSSDSKPNMVTSSILRNTVNQSHQGNFGSLINPGNYDKKIHIPSSAKYQTTSLGKNPINYIKHSTDFGKKKTTEVIEIVENMVVPEKEAEKHSKMEEKIGKMIAVEVEPEKKDNLYDIHVEFKKESPVNKNLKELTKEFNKEVIKEFRIKEKSKGEIEETNKESFREADIKRKESKDPKEIKENKDTKDTKDTKETKEKLSYKILAKKELLNPRAKSPVVNYNNIALKSKIKQFSSSDVIDFKILKTVNNNPERASKKITLDLNLKKKEPDSKRLQTEVEMKEETQAGLAQRSIESASNKNRSNTAEKSEPISARFQMSTKVSLKDKETIKLINNSIKGKSSSNQLEINNKDVNNIILLEKLQKACSHYSYSLKEISQSKYECSSKDNNVIGVEICKNNSKGSKALKLSHVKGKETATKDMIKKITINTGI